jgi:LAO/AO transport system kinase
LVDAASAGDRTAVARLISLIERGGDPAREVARLTYSMGDAYTIGMTGAPGAGKSTLTDRLITEVRATAQPLGVLAIDPSSPFTGGAILGDRVRMQGHALDEGVFIRSMATRGHLGGLALATPEAVRVLAAAGMPIVIIETVGVGQVEVEVARAADSTVVVVNPGWGDSIQANKAGLLEIADIFVINKADRDGVDRVEQEIRAMQSLAAHHAEWIPSIIRTVANTGEGLPELIDAISAMEKWLADQGRFEARRKAYWRERILEMMRHALMRQIRRHSLTDAELDHLATEVAGRKQDPYRTVPKLVESAFGPNEQHRT